MLTESSYALLRIFSDAPILFALFIMLFDIPRYTLSLISLLLTGLWTREPDAKRAGVSVVIPVLDGADDLAACVHSVFDQSLPPESVTLIDDGSSDRTWDVMLELREIYSDIRLLRHPRPSGKSASVNHAALLSQSELLLVVDHDVVLGRDFIHNMTGAFTDPDVAAASGNLYARNATQSPLTALQSLEYLQSITLGRSFIDKINAISCVSGAVSMFRKSVFDALGGLNTGPGEDLEITLRMRANGHRIRFVTEATAYTGAPDSLRALTRQRSRWDRDALNIKLLAYRQLRLTSPGEQVSDTFMRFDFLLLEFLPTMIFPFYLAGMFIYLGPDFPVFLWGMTGLLFWFYLLHGLLVLSVARLRISVLEILMLPLLPLYQGVYLKLVRFWAFSSELLFSTSRRDPFVPARIRHALYSPEREALR